MAGIEFGINVQVVPSGREFAQVVRRADQLGYDVFAAQDHLGGLSPFTALTAAGMISERLRLRTHVLNTGFWNGALLARDAAAAAEELRRRQALYGFDSVTTHQAHLEALGEVINAYRASSRD